MKTNTLVKSVIAIIIAFAGCYGVYVTVNRFATAPVQDTPQQNVGGSFALGTKYFLTAGSGTATDAGSREATSTKVYLQTTDTASSTITGILERGDQIDLKLRAVATSSSATLRFAVEGSDNGVDYYPIDYATTTTSQPSLLSVGEQPYSWNLATSSPAAAACNTTSANETCREFTLKGFYSKYFRIRFGVTGANAAVWAVAQPRDLVPN